MANYNCSQLEHLWIQAGGPSGVAALMANIAMAESSGNPGAVNPKSGATGLWQILPLPGRPGGMTDPLANAKEAVSLYNTQGLGAWDASKPVWSVQQPCGAATAPSGAPGPSAGSQQPANASTLPTQCIHPLSLGLNQTQNLGGGTVCMDGPLGFLAAGLGVLAMIIGLAALAGRFSLPGPL